MYAFSEKSLCDIAAQILSYAKSLGATDAETCLHESLGQSVNVRKGYLETVEHHQRKGLSVSIFLGQRRGHASSSDLSLPAIRYAVEKAFSIARLTQEDPFLGLADADQMQSGPLPPLELHHAWDLSVEQATELAQQCEQAAFDASPHIKNSDGAMINSASEHFIQANSRGFMAGYPSSAYSISCAVIAQKDDQMQQDSWTSSARNPSALEDEKSIGIQAAQRAAARLNARKIKTCRCPVLFQSPVSHALLSALISACSGGNLYRKSSFLLDHLGQQIFPKSINIVEDPTLIQAFGSRAFDDDCVKTQRRYIVRNGQLEGYFLSTYSARKLAMLPTGNGGGTHNLLVSAQGGSFDDLLKQMGTGLVVTEMLGQGFNLVTGDFSRGASGFWVENGEIQYPVEEITVAGNLKEIFMGILAVGEDRVVHGSKYCGSVLVDGLQIAGS